MGGVVVVPSLALALVIAFAIAPVESIDGFTLRGDALDVLRAALLVFAAIAVVHLIAAFAERLRAARWAGVAGGAAGAATLAVLAALVAGPGVVVRGGAGEHARRGGRARRVDDGDELGALVSDELGAAEGAARGDVAGCCWARSPRRRRSWSRAAVAPVRETPLTQAAFGVALGENPAFWLRVGVGLAFPAVLAWLAWRAASIRGMMAATGLLYIAVGAVLTGEILARGLLFATGAAV